MPEAVNGRCGASDYYRVVASRPSTSAKVSGRADSAGDFSATFAGRMDLQPGDRLALSCKRVSGDMLHLGGPGRVRHTGRSTQGEARAA